ncbi:alpha/beta fold hydrolase [Mycobacteroides sp. PCS013]|uniref:alpha/beta fold hydrolase n=1 Tax=Mycobacteroides sp. PCS013 TaxID=3074106 RepID=UPI003C2C5B73
MSTTTEQVRKRAQRNTKVAMIGAVRTRVLDVDGSGPTILLIHGFTESADGWRSVLDMLGEQGHRCVAVDLPHFGRAARPVTTGYLSAVDDFIAAAVRQFDRGDGVVLVGNSVGGLAVLRAAQRADLPLVAAVAIGPAGLHTTWWMRLVRRVRPATDWILGLPIRPVFRGTVTAPALISAGFARAVAAGRLTPEAKAQYASHWGPGDLRRQLMLGGETIVELSRPDALANARFAAPVTAIWGSKDWVCPPRGAKALRDRHPDAMLQFIDGSGHCPQYDQPVRVAEIIRAAIADAVSSRAVPTTLQEKLS